MDETADDGSGINPRVEKPEDRAVSDEQLADDLGKVILFFIGLRMWRVDHEPATLDRPRWDRLCVLHLLVMTFINEFCYSWQVRTKEDFQRAMKRIVQPETANALLRSFDGLGLTWEETNRFRRLRRELGERHERWRQAHPGILELTSWLQSWTPPVLPNPSPSNADRAGVTTTGESS